MFLASLGKDVSWEKVVYQTFDNIGWAMSTLFEMSTTEGWVDIMWASVDATGVDMQPIRDHNEAPWVTFWIMFIIMGSFFVINLFVGVVCDTFNEMKSQLGGLFLLTDRQKEWVSMRKKINTLGAYIRNVILKKVPTNPLRRKIFYLV